MVSWVIFFLVHWYENVILSEFYFRLALISFHPFFVLSQFEPKKITYNHKSVRLGKQIEWIPLVVVVVF